MIKWLTMGVLPILAIIFMSAKANEVMTRDKGTYVVNTTTLAADVNGYLETTPLLIYIKGNKIDHIEALPNQETPKYFFRIKKELLNKWDGKDVKKVLKELQNCWRSLK